MAAATALGGRCPMCDLPHPCPTQFDCIRRWAYVLLDLLPDEEPYRTDPERAERITYWEYPGQE
jgi:hypothetical protein